MKKQLLCIGLLLSGANLCSGGTFSKNHRPVLIMFDGRQEHQALWDNYQHSQKVCAKSRAALKKLRDSSDDINWTDNKDVSARAKALLDHAKKVDTDATRRNEEALRLYMVASLTKSLDSLGLDISAIEKESNAVAHQTHHLMQATK